jgi:hypothetical protein
MEQTPGNTWIEHLVLELSMKGIVVLIVLAASSPALSQEWSAESCSAALQGAYSPFSGRSGASTRGDFNGDGKTDFALLLDNSRGTRKSAIGVCLSKEPRPLLITAPYATATISTKPRGTAYMDRETGKKGAYERDVISVSDGPGAGASYVLRVGVFARVVDGD